MVFKHTEGNTIMLDKASRQMVKAILLKVAAQDENIKVSLKRDGNFALTFELSKSQDAFWDTLKQRLFEAGYDGARKIDASRRNWVYNLEITPRDLEAEQRAYAEAEALAFAKEVIVAAEIETTEREASLLTDGNLYITVGEFFMYRKWLICAGFMAVLPDALTDSDPVIVDGHINPDGSLTLWTGEPLYGEPTGHSITAVRTRLLRLVRIGNRPCKYPVIWDIRIYTKGKPEVSGEMLLQDWTHFSYGWPLDHTINIYINKRYTDTQYKGTVNWPAIGTTAASDTLEFSSGLHYAALKADRIAGYFDEVYPQNEVDNG